MVGLQAEVGIETETNLSVNLKELLQKLHEPLSDKEKPTPIPMLSGSVDPSVSNDLDQNRYPSATVLPKLLPKRQIEFENPFINDYHYDYMSNDVREAI